jgi:hypothetical protein
VLLVLNLKNVPAIEGPLAMKLVACVVVTLMYAVPIALVAGAMRGIWRMVGGWLFLPLTLVPLAVLLAFWIGSGWLFDQGIRVLEELLLAGKEQGFEHTKSMASVAQVAHAGAPGAVIAVVMILPFFAADLFLVDLDFLWSLLRFFFSALAVAALGAIPSLLASGTVLAVVFVRRLKQRYVTFAKSAA